MIKAQWGLVINWSLGIGVLVIWPAAPQETVTLKGTNGC